MVKVPEMVPISEKRKRERELLRILAAGEREIAAGKGHSLASVMKEADTLLADDAS